MPNANIEKNSWEVMKWLELWHRKEPTTAVPDTPMNRKERGGPKVLLSGRACDLADANRGFTSVLDAAIVSASLSDKLLPGREKAWQVFAAVQYEPTEVNNRRAENGPRWRALRVACLMVAMRVAEVLQDLDGNPLRFRVVTDPDEAARIAEQSDDPRRLGYGKVRSLTAHDSYRKIVEDMEAMVEAKTHSKDGAKAAKADQLMCSLGRINDAITAVNKERPTLFDGTPTKDSAA